MQIKVAANAQAMKRWLDKAETAIGNHSDRLNAINIFPVADGDTGTNLYLTVRAAARALHSGVAGDPEAGQTDVGLVLAKAGRAALEQARGNSGTLFSVFLCAAAEPLAGHTRLTAGLLAAALNRAQIRAWSALSDPVPGTMLSVMEAAARAADAVGNGKNGDASNHALSLALDAAVNGALAAVVNTEGQLPALQEAHVVDAGGVGMLVILDCLRAAIMGAELQGELLDGLHGYDIQDPHIHIDMPDDDGVEVMCTISLSPLSAATLRQRLDEIGDSVIMSQVDSVAAEDGNYRWRVHVHVPDAGPAVALIRSLGEPGDISVSDLALARNPEPAPVNSNGHER